MARIPHPDTSFAPILQRIEARLGALERHGPGSLPLPLLASSQWSPSSTTNNAYADIPASVTASFTLPSPTYVLVVCVGYGKTSGASGNYSYVRTRLGIAVGDLGGAYQNFDKANGGFVNFASIFRYDPFWTGSGGWFSPNQPMTAALQAGSDVGQTLLIQAANLMVFGMGQA